MNESPLRSSVTVDLCLHAVFLNNNTRTQIPRSAIDTASLHRFQTRVAVGEIRLKLSCGKCRLVIDVKNGNALLHLWRARQALAAAAVVTNPLEADELWQFLQDLQVGDAGWGPPDRMPESDQPRAFPWLAVNLSPVFLASADRKIFRQLAELHWVVGWAVVEHVAELQTRN